MSSIEQAQPAVRALGVTDYFCIRGYRRVREYARVGRLPGVTLIFPNVEMRLSVETERRKAINLHLLFAPDDEDHEAQIERILGQLSFEYRGSTYTCRIEELQRLGAAVDPDQTDAEARLRIGANQFKVELRQLKELFRAEAWLSRNCLVAVAAAEGDGTGGLQGDSSFLALREELEAFAHVVFSGKPSDREYWLGKKRGFGPDVIEKKYGALKPCLHGSDAHRTERVAAPDLDRACWIKANLTFDGLRQAVIEPEQRVAIGKEAPLAPANHERIAAVAVSDGPWFSNGRIELNPGLVAIIGARGSGKTALADILACATDALTEDAGDASFLRRALRPENLLGDAISKVEWADGDHAERRLASDIDLFDDERSSPRVRYLSQQFVERLCSADGLAGDLVREIEAVVFQSIDETERLGASSFSELRDIHVEPLQRRQGELRADIEQSSKQIAAEDATHEKVPALSESKKQIATRIEAAKKELDRLIPKGKEERAKRLAALDAACKEAEAAVQQLKLGRQKVEELRTEVDRIRSEVEPARMVDLQRRYAVLGLVADDWKKFALHFVGDVDAVLDARAKVLDDAVSIRMAGDAKQPIDTTKTPSIDWPVNVLRQLREELRKEVGADATKATRVAELNKEIAQQEQKIKKLDEQLTHDAGYKDRRKELVQNRRTAYANIFDALRDEQLVLEKLYAPLAKRLEQTDGPLRKLAFVVRRRVDLDAWVRAGEQLLDLRTAGSLRGKGALREVAAKELLPAWMSGGASDVASALETFLTAHWADIQRGRPSGIDAAHSRAWLNDVGRWLFSTHHIRLEYGIVYDGQDVERLSPGTRGIVLLTLYLAVDEWDRRPLLVDQPEENLDPKSIFDELVAYFRAARLRRQVILVTHNANLVVNTDADQVIVATATRLSATGLPQLSYRAGGLEDPVIRRDVCALLEGGERAFLEREKRYRFLQDRRT
ncbi:MAG: AAA family ATPase [Labilithrix sp.]|nr:AAA family ATPase [Labilithrix sp.]